MLRLKEKPIEWIKFTAVMGVSLNLLAWLLWWKGWLPLALALGAAAAALLAVTVAVLRPRWFRGFYRGGMTLSFHFGQVFGTVLLTLVFFLLVTPMGLLLRLLGKDLLRLKKDPTARTYWHPAKENREFDRMF